jgi:galactokinase
VLSQTASAYAPGRVELLGNHTDYNQGVVLAAAIDRGLTVSGSSRDDGMISLRASAPSARVLVSLENLQPQTEQRWANYPLGVVQQLQRAGYDVGGFEASVSGNVPAGAGLSSSAAFEVATAGFLMKLLGWRIEPIRRRLSSDVPIISCISTSRLMRSARFHSRRTLRS